MNLFTRNSPYYHLLKYLLFLLKHPVGLFVCVFCALVGLENKLYKMYGTIYHKTSSLSTAITCVLAARCGLADYDAVYSDALLPILLKSNMLPSSWPSCPVDMSPVCVSEMSLSLRYGVRLHKIAQ